jgi:hypothetical protein
MDYHKNAPWRAISRERLARMVISDGMSLSSAAARFSQGQGLREGRVVLAGPIMV